MTDTNKLLIVQIMNDITDLIIGEDITPKRSRNSKGRFIADNKTTDYNEAWVGGKNKKTKIKGT